MSPDGLDARLTLTRGTLDLDLELAVEPGEVVALVGPNGAGKTTALRCLAGLLPLSDRGRIALAGRVWDDPARRCLVPAARRGVGMVFQDHQLFPHLDLLENVAFGLRARGVRRHPARAEASRWLERVGLADLARARPNQVSGGQAQRAALARALVTAPGLLLLDEPLAALDAGTRLQVRSELGRHLADFPGATVLVTHDPVDAAVLADRLVVLEQGRVVQTGSPVEVSRRPATDYVARLVGLNLLRGRAEGTRVRCASGLVLTTARSAHGPVHCLITPSAVSVFTRPPEGSPRNVVAGQVAGMAPHGEGVRLDVELDSGDRIHAEVTPAAVHALRLGAGTPVWVGVKASEIDVEEIPA